MKEKFLPAFRGLAEGWKDPGVRIQLILAALAGVAGLVLKLEAMEWIAVILCIALVISAEILNTCIEKICDCYTDEYDERIRVIKDMAAAAVLVSSFGALACALIILFRHL